MTAVPSLLDVVGVLTGRAPKVFSRAALVTMSHELEDRYGVQRRAAPLLFGGFQRARFFAEDRDRWRRFAEGAAIAAVAYGGEAARHSCDGLEVLVVGRDDPFWRDWVCLAYAGERRSGLLVARDQEPNPCAPEGPRRCLALVSHDHRVVRAAAVWIGHYLSRHDPDLAVSWRRELLEVPVETPWPRRRRVRR